MTRAERLSFETPRGPVSATFDQAAKGSPVLVIAHGAGAGQDHPFLVGFAEAMTQLGVSVLRFNFPYMEQGRRSVDPQPVAIETWRSAFDLAGELSKGEAVFVGGKSYGGRMASVAVSEGMDANGLVFLGYPLHPPGKPERIRDEHLYGIRAPMLFLEGTRDSFATPELVEKVVKKLGIRATLVWIEGGDHSFNQKGVKRSPHDVGASLAEPAATFVRSHL